MEKIAIVIQPRIGKSVRIEGFKSDEDFITFCLTLFEAASLEGWTVDELVEHLAEAYEIQEESSSESG